MEFFQIVCSDEQIVLMDRVRLERLLDTMPTLRFLFFGHPDMRQTDLEVQDGCQVVKIPDYLHVTKGAFLEAVHAVLEFPSLPALDGCELDAALKPIMGTLSTLGGCDEMVDRVREHKEQMKSAVASNPLTPEEDVNHLYHWVCVQKDAGASPGCYAKQGLSFTKMITEHGDANAYLLYRKLKSDP